MRRLGVAMAWALAAGMVVGPQAHAQMPLPAPAPPDPATLFARQCGTCHVATPEGAPRQGPNLWGVFGRKAGSVEGFQYIGKYAESGIVWDEATLDTYLTNPQAMIPGSVMAYRQANADVRHTIIAWLKDQH